MSETNQGRLGRGLSALLPSASEQKNDQSEAPSGPLTNEVRTIAIADIEPSSLQPRRLFDDEQMASLVRSVAEKGVIQPILVRRNNVRSRSGRLVRFCSPSQTCPLSASSIPLMILRIVLLPLPLLPKTAVNSPFLNEALAFSSTIRVLPPS